MFALLALMARKDFCKLWEAQLVQRCGVNVDVSQTMLVHISVPASDRARLNLTERELY